MTALEAYAHVKPGENGKLLLQLTYKPYFDQEYNMDDGLSDDIWPMVTPFTQIKARLGLTRRIAQNPDGGFFTDLPNQTRVPVAQRVLINMTRPAGVKLIFGNKQFDEVCSKPEI